MYIAVLIEDAKSTTGCIIASTGISDNSNRYSTVIGGESQAYTLPVSRVRHCSHISVYICMYACIKTLRGLALL